MNDNQKRLLEDAAYCAGMDVQFCPYGTGWRASIYPFAFDPFMRGSHAMELQIAARIDVKHREDRVICERFVGDYLAKAEEHITMQPNGRPNREDATKIAIIRCAAEAGRFMRDNNIKEQRP